MRGRSHGALGGEGVGDPLPPPYMSHDALRGSGYIGRTRPQDVTPSVEFSLCDFCLFVGEMSQTRRPLGSLRSYENVHGEESLRRRVMQRTPVQRHTMQMYERREEAWRPLTRQRVAAFLRLIMLCFVERENGLPLEPVTYRLLKKTLCKRIIPWIDRLLVFSLDETYWPISMNNFKELDRYLVSHLPNIHAGQPWQNVVHFFKEVQRHREEEEEDAEAMNYLQFRQTDEYYRDVVDFC